MAKHRFPGIVLALSITLAGSGAATAGGPGGDRDDESPWGIASGAEWSGEYPRFNPLLKKAGVRWLRIFDEWQVTEPRRGEWNWKGMDAKVADARSNGIRLTGGFWYFAPWASATGDTRTCPVRDIQAWSEYVGAAVGRYKKDIRYWEVWNEFNGSFSNSKDKPKDYADLVVAAYDAAKKADPECMIGIGCANFDLGFFDRAIKAGAANHFDFVCVHPYENLSMAMDDGEAGFLSLAGSLRKMLAENKQRAEMPLWITEIGYQSSIKPDANADALQEEALAKAYLLSLAQGFQRIFWFEARGPAYGAGTDHGILRQDWSVRPAYDALSTLTRLLGPEPRYLGWLDLAGGTHAFAFQGPGGPVLAAWSPTKGETRARFPEDVRVVPLTGKEFLLSKGEELALTRTPVLLTGVPRSLSTEAAANAKKPFPWGGDYARAELVRCRLGATNVDQGIRQTSLGTTVVVNLLDQSYRRTDVSNPALGGEGHYTYFRVDPAFAPFGTKALEITVVARRFDPGKPSGMGLTYESLSGYKGAEGWWNLPEGDQWTEHTWNVSDASFAGGWGWNFRTDASGSGTDFLIKEVRVKKAARQH